MRERRETRAGRRAHELEARSARLDQCRAYFAPVPVFSSSYVTSQYVDITLQKDCGVDE